MIYQLRTTLFFSTLDAIEDIKDKILDHWPNALAINPDTSNSEYSILELIENHHDDDPNGACTLIYTLTNEPPPPE